MGKRGGKGVSGLVLDWPSTPVPGSSWDQSRFRYRGGGGGDRRSWGEEVPLKPRMGRAPGAKREWECSVRDVYVADAGFGLRSGAPPDQGNRLQSPTTWDASASGSLSRRMKT